MTKPLSEKCIVCEKEITGTSYSQIDYNMKIHIMFSHPDYKPKKEVKK
jgi:hypothetical protein